MSGTTFVVDKNRKRNLSISGSNLNKITVGENPCEQVNVSNIHPNDGKH